MAEVAGRQFGLITWAQLNGLGVAKTTVRGWVDQGYLMRVLPRVYAVGHRPTTTEAKLAAALLYAGPGAELSHGTAAWWVGLTGSRPYRVDVSTPRRPRSVPGIKVHTRRQLDRVLHNGLPVTRFEQTMVDYASQASLTKVRLALARADHDGTLNARALAGVLRPGCPGTVRLRTALERHLPRLADTKSLVEATFVELCETYELPLPEVNARVAGWEVDIVWRKQRLVVELDGPSNHRTPAQVRRDRRKEMELRGLTFLVLRYSDEQVLYEGPAMMQEVCAVYADRDQPS